MAASSSLSRCIILLSCWIRFQQPTQWLGCFVPNFSDHDDNDKANPAKAARNPEDAFRLNRYDKENSRGFARSLLAAVLLTPLGRQVPSYDQKRRGRGGGPPRRHYNKRKNCLKRPPSPPPLVPPPCSYKRPTTMVMIWTWMMVEPIRMRTMIYRKQR
jgi:hypothetical protein